MSDAIHVSPSYVNGSHHIEHCRHCHWVGHISITNAPRTALPENAPMLNRCPNCGRSIFPDDTQPGEENPPWI